MTDKEISFFRANIKLCWYNLFVLLIRLPFGYFAGSCILVSMFVLSIDKLFDKVYNCFKFVLDKLPEFKPDEELLELYNKQQQDKINKRYHSLNKGE